MKFILLPLMLIMAGEAASQSNDTWIECGETEQTNTMSPGHFSRFYSFQVEAGSRISFRSVPYSSTIEVVDPGGESLGSVSGSGTTVLCDVEITLDGVHSVLYSAGGPSDSVVSLTMFCTAAPAECTTAVASRTWAQVKVLYR